jgi:hypothetical protein
MINNPLSWEAIRQYILQSDLLAEKPRPAVTGWIDGSISTADRPNFIKVRFYDTAEEAEVYNVSVPLVRGVQVYVYKGFDGILRAKHPSHNYQVKDLWFSFIKNHAPNHSAYGVDPLYVETRSFLPLHPYVSGTWSITIKPGWTVFGDQSYWFAGETVSIHQYRPTSGARFVLLSAGLEDIAGVMTVKMIVTQGLAKDLLAAPGDFPKIPAETVPICAVRASIKKIKLQDKQVDGDLYDLRLSAGVPTGSSYSDPTLAARVTQLELLIAEIFSKPRILEPIIFDGELLMFDNDVVVMEV